MKLFIVLFLMLASVSRGDDLSQNEKELPTASQAHTQTKEQRAKAFQAEKEEFIQNVKSQIDEAIKIGNFDVEVYVPKRMKGTFSRLSRKLKKLGYSMQRENLRQDDLDYNRYPMEPGDALYQISW